MRILALCQGHYGQRIVDHIRKSAPQDWWIEVVSAPRGLPLVIDEPEEFVPANVPQADLLLALSESPATAQLVPAIAGLSKVKAVILPVDNSTWLPPGLKNQVQQELQGMRVAAAFPKTFCTLTERTAGFGGDVETYASEDIDCFARYFGRPRMRIKLNAQGTRILEVTVERSAPCGSTHRVAERLIGVAVEEAVPQAGLFAHHYPCLASMHMEPTGDTLMHVSGYVVNDEVERELKLWHRA